MSPISFDESHGFYLFFLFSSLVSLSSSLCCPLQSIMSNFIASDSGLTVKNQWKVFEGTLIQLTHFSSATKTDMRFSIFLPSSASSAPLGSIPVIFWLSGLTCTDENFAQKASVAFKTANAKGVAIVLPDTSPRGAGCPEDKDSWDFGEGAGFYLDATNPAYSSHYNMNTYVHTELPSLLSKSFPILSSKRGVMGHSMGGHGALTLYLRNPTAYASCSAFAPIVNPSNCPWGQKVFGKYFGDINEGTNARKWAEHDACELVKTFVTRGGDSSRPILIHQGLADNFYKQKQLLPENFVKACDEGGVKLQYHAVEGYDHSYFFVTSFIEQHVAFHADFLLQ